VAKEEYDTLKAWGLDKPKAGHKAQAQYWRSMAKSLRRILAEKDIYIEQLENKIQILTGQYNDEQGT
tara:strand:+ start:451 stop:651 length:201 start_codon:yes stop_codon:yes gene_type:complete